MSLIRLLHVFVFLLASFGADPARASEIALSPLRQVVTAEAPRATFRLSNPTDRILDVRIGWIDLAATPEGYAPATARQRSQWSATPFLTLRPASLRLEPGRSAEVEVALKPGTTPPAGERRSHVLIEIDAARSPLRRIGGLEVDIGLAVSAPVILRGRGSASATIGDTRFERTPDGLLEVISSVQPTGEHSAYGKLVADFTPRDGAPITLGEVRNVAGYPDARRRRAVIRLEQPKLPAGALTLRYVGEAEFEGRVFAARTFAVAAPPAGAAPRRRSSDR